MSPQAARIVFLICAASVAALLLVAGGTIDAIAAVLVAAGARPGWWMAEKIMLAQALEQAATFLEVLRHADEASPLPDQALQALPARKQRAHRE